MTLDEMIGLAEGQARRVLIGTKAGLVPTWVLLRENGKVELVGTPWRNDEEKDAVEATMRSLMKAGQVVAYSLLVETWFATVDKGADPMIRPRHRRDRKEGVNAIASHRDGRKLHRHWEIIRAPDGTCSELKRLDGPEDQITSRFDFMLGRPN